VSAFSLPFRFENGRVAATTDPVRIVNQKIVDVLVTGNLERVGIPSYGAGVYNYVFENFDELIEADIKIDLVREVQTRVSGASVIDVSILQEAPSEYVITVYYRTPVSGIETLVFNLNRPDLLTEESSLT
jgi:phage baseplate assembly protein W